MIPKFELGGIQQLHGQDEGGRGSKNVCFCPRSGCKNCPRKGGGGSKNGKILSTNALSFYAAKTVLVGPKWFWSDQIDLDLTIMIWSRPK